MTAAQPLISNDAIVMGLLALILGVVFHAVNSDNRYCKRFFRFVPAILLCYLLPAILSTLGIVAPGGKQLWLVAKNYLLPASLILMTLSIDLKAVLGLGNKALIMFFTATVGIILGGPVAMLIVATFNPELVGGEGAQAVWRGFATLAGSWIGGAANQTSMLELYGYDPEKYATMVAIDIIVANIWMMFLLYGAGHAEKIDRWLKADTSALEEIKIKMDKFSIQHQQYLTFPVLMKIFAVAFVGVGLSHLIADFMSPLLAQSENELFSKSILSNHFFWIVVVSTSFGLGLSFTRFRQLDGAGASKFGSMFIYLLVAIIGTKMQLNELSDNLGLVLVGMVWMLFHVGLLVLVAKKIRAPFFFLAVGSKANIGGAASAPVVAAAFHPSLAPVGVLLAVLGYGLGTYGAIMCAQLMHVVAGL